MSKSKSTTKSSATNTNIVFDDIDGIAVAGNGNTIQTLDGGAIKASFAFGKDANRMAFAFGDDANRRAFAFGDDALSLVDTSNRRMLAFGEQTINQALDYTQDIIMTSAEKQNEQMSNLFLYLGLGALVVLGLKYVR